MENVELQEINSRQALHAVIEKYIHMLESPDEETCALAVGLMNADENFMLNVKYYHGYLTACTLDHYIKQYLESTNRWKEYDNLNIQATLQLILHDKKCIYPLPLYE